MQHRIPTALLAAAALAALSAPAQAVVGVYDTYFVTTEVTSGAPGGNGGFHSYNARSSNIASLPGAESGGRGTFSAAGSTFDTTGRLTAATSSGMTTGSISGVPTLDSNLSVARADLAAGTLAASVTTLTPDAGFASGSAFAQMHDIVTLNVAGAAADTRTRITVRYSIDGSYAVSGPTPFGNPPQATTEAKLYINNPNSAQGSLFASALVLWNPNAGAAVPTLVGTTDQFTGAGDAFGTGKDVFGAGSWAGSTATALVFTGSFDIVGASATLNPTLTLDVNCGLAVCAQTARFSFVDLAPGVSVTSNSGVFLSPVPEPQGWALMLAGLAGVGFVARRRVSSAR